MRTFIAIDIGEKVTAAIGGLQDEIRGFFGDTRRGVKWVDPDLIHLTLKFLGEIDDEQVVEVCKAVEEVSAGFGEFDVAVEKVGSFGRPARVVWIGTEESEQLCRLQGDLDARLAEIGFSPDEKKFVPHLTLCRVKDFAAGRRLGRIIDGFDDFCAGKIHVKSVCVYKSELTKTGPEYTLLACYNLV